MKNGVRRVPRFHNGCGSSRGSDGYPLRILQSTMQRYRHLQRGMGVSASDESIYRGLRDELVRYASALVGPDDGPDLLSTVVARTLSRRSLADLADPRMYLFRAISNEASSVRRTRARRQVVRLNAIDAPSYMMDPVDEVLEIVWELPVRQRAATYLVYWLEFTPTEAAEAMGCRPGTVRRYLHLARTRLKEALDEFNP